MDEITTIYERLGERVTFSDFKAKVEEKVAMMGGLCDEETAALLIAQELGAGEPIIKIKDMTPDGRSVCFTCKVVSISDPREFSRSDGSAGRVANITVGDETGTVRVSLWDELAAAVGELEVGQHLQVSGYAKEGYAGGIEVSIGRTGNIEPIEPAREIAIEVKQQAIADLCSGMFDVNVIGRVLQIGDVRTFTRKRGSESGGGSGSGGGGGEGRVGNITIGDATGKVRMTLWDEKTKIMDDLNIGDCIEITCGYTRENYYDGRTELQVGDQGDVKKSDTDVSYTEEITPLADIGLDEVCTVVGYVTGLEETKEITRSDGNISRVTNIHISDETGNTRVRAALWGEHADTHLDIGDNVQMTDCLVKSGWGDAVELSVGWKSSVRVIRD